MSRISPEKANSLLQYLERETIFTKINDESLLRFNFSGYMKIRICIKIRNLIRNFAHSLIYSLISISKENYYRIK